MERANRSELLRTVSSLQEQVNRYEKRLKDVVVAYKGTLKEKEALEATIKAFSDTATPAPQAASLTVPDSTGDTEGSAGETSGSETEDSDELSKLSRQVATLTKSLSTLMSEKTKMEASYQSERKKLRQEHDDYVANAEEDCRKYEETINKIQSENEEWKARVRTAQHERERDQSDHSLMLKELQKLLADERTGKELLEQQLDDTKMKLLAKESSPDPVEHYKKSINDMRNELEVVRNRLAASEEASMLPSPLLLDLQKEMAKLKSEHHAQLEKEQRKSREAEGRMRSLAAQGEERVSGLEVKISELSEVVGSYERLRAQDKESIARLRERITQLDEENTALVKAANRVSSCHDDRQPPEEGDMDVPTMVERITKLKNRLVQANKSMDQPVNLQEVFLVETDDNKLHERCREELEALKEEFERYKLRAQSVLKNKSSKETGSREVESLKTQLADVKERLRVSKSEHEQELVSRSRVTDDLRAALTSAQEAARAQLVDQQGVHKQRQAELEAEIRRHRDRTIALLVEKDREIELLRARSPERNEAQLATSYAHAPRAGSPPESDPELSASEKDQGDEKTAVSELLRGGATDTSGLLHFAQEQARRDVEIQALRRARHLAETALRELQHTSAAKQQRLVEELEQVREEVRRLERGRSRESANLEYLKNVVYRYMVCAESGGKQNMLRAIATILEFSPREYEAVRRAISGGWWGGGGK